MSEVASPCVALCRIGPGAPWCEGCRRTLDEIAAWSTLDDAGRRAVLARVEARGFDDEALPPSLPSSPAD